MTKPRLILFRLENLTCAWIAGLNNSMQGPAADGLDLVGVSAGPTRRPVLPLAQEHREEIRALLTAAGVETVEDPVAA